MKLTSAASIGSEIPDYERYDYSSVWARRSIEDMAERELIRSWAATAGTRGGDCIDLGGGFGRITQILEPCFARTFMVDFSFRNLRMASRRLKRTTLIRARLDSLPFKSGVFDFVTLIRVIHHIPDPDALLAEVSRVARDGATFVMGFANERITGNAKLKQHVLKMVSAQGHRIYATPLSRYSGPYLERREIRGVGAFDNRIGARLERLSPLSSLDVATSGLWPVKPMLFVRFVVRKDTGDTGDRMGPVHG